METETSSYGSKLNGLVLESLTSEHKFSKIQRKIKHLNRHVMISIKSEDGDIIDCIDIRKQPAFDHPSLKNLTIQMTPSYDTTPQGASSTKMGKDYDSDVTITTQLWQKSGSCPKGAIPVRGVPTKYLVSRSYGRKGPAFSHRVTHSDDAGSSNLKQPNHSLAILLTAGYTYLGGKADIKVWNPRVESDDEYSTSRVTLKSGPYFHLESIESGWTVNPSVYGDRQTRFYEYWTADSSNKTGCFKLTCPGFVQTSNEIALGVAIYPISTFHGLPYQITVYIVKDLSTNNWWVQYGEKINIGYWPAELFRSVSHHAEGVDWGGEVYSSRVGTTPHTKTAMGSGNFPDPFGYSGSMIRMRIRDNSLFLKFPEWVSTFADEYRCFDVAYHGDYVVDPEFYFGGPGRNPICP
ncbi:Neprosin [Dillenia turbinata]|uniref:Neprosin n=1 Tax=Dillenia turbinata TaxID=194707 RepID=A0AAN8UJ93_9MAGN